MLQIISKLFIGIVIIALFTYDNFKRKLHFM